MRFPLINSPMTENLLGIPNSTSSTANIMHVTKTSVVDVAWNWCLIYDSKMFYCCVEVHFFDRESFMLRLKFVTTNRHVFESEFDGKALCAACATAQVSRVLLPFIRRQPVDLNARLQAWGWRFSTIQMQPFKWWKAGTSNLHWLGIFKNTETFWCLYFQ